MVYQTSVSSNCVYWHRLHSDAGILILWKSLLKSCCTHNTLLCFVYKSRSVYALLLTTLIKTPCFPLSFAFVLIFSTQWLVRNDFSFWMKNYGTKCNIVTQKLRDLQNFFRVFSDFFFIFKEICKTEFGIHCLIQAVTVLALLWRLCKFYYIFATSKRFREKSMAIMKYHLMFISFHNKLGILKELIN
jgi:hypothetical protein